MTHGYEDMVTGFQRRAASWNNNVITTNHKCHNHVIWKCHIPQGLPRHLRRGGDDILHDLAIYVTQGVDFHGDWGYWIRCLSQFQPPGDQWQRPSLGNRGNKDNKKDDVEEQVAVLDTSQEWKGRQRDWYSPFQSNPAEKYKFSQAKTERKNRNHVGKWSSYEDQHQGDHQTFGGNPEQSAGKTEQSQHDEKNDLPKPGACVMKKEDPVAEYDGTVAKNDTGQVYREESTPSEYCSQAKGEQTEG